MTDTIDQTILWLKDFKSNWLPKHVPADVPLVELITIKLLELERLLLGNETRRFILNETTKRKLLIFLPRKTR